MCFCILARYLRRNISLSATCLALQYFSILSLTQKYFGKRLLKIKCVLIFSLQMLSEIFLILKRIQLDLFIYLHRSLRILIKFESNFSNGFSKSLNIKFKENPTNESCVVTCGHIEEQMD